MIGARLLSVLLVVTLLVPGGVGQLDLCACQGGEHGLFCSQAEAPQPRAHGCCAMQGDEDRNERTQAPDHCPDCPKLDLGDSAGNKLPATGEPCGGQLALVYIEPPPSLLAPHDRRLQTTACWPRPPPGKHRLHLLHRVFLL